jgi:class 3 adenylate cyclase/tetratricopeptide (TPR) repeat protein
VKPESSPSKHETVRGTEPKFQDIAERREVTVMFSDLVGSTALSARMDPEDLREVISAYQKCVAETVQRSGGFVAKYMGDGVLIYFGYPQAHEDDAERAVRAGLELVASVSVLKSHVALQTRVGIATGLVVVGDLIGSGASQEQAIVGETPNLAARLQGVAEPNSVVIAEGTRRLVGNLFELEDLGVKDLKGIGGPVRAWAALRQASVESRFEAMHATGLTDLVGREEELELLLRRWSKAKTGEGQVVLLSGEPGIGKSRLTAALLERVATEPHKRLRYFCSPQHTDSALYPIISQMERAAGLAHGDTVQAKLDKLDAALAQSFTPRKDAALFAEMLSLPNDGRYPTLELAPQQRRQKTLEALTAQLEALSRSNPTLMIFEDAHWVDPTSLEALGRTVDRIRTLGVLLIVTHRLEFEPPWIGRPHVTTLTINRLGQREIAAMIDRVTSNKPLPAGIRQDIIERTDGIPLFVEEVTKAVLETGGEEASERTVAAIPSPSVAVPASLHASLMARLDRLGSAKEVAQIGAVIGREFSHPLLAAVAGKPETELQSALSRLIKAGLLFSQGVPPNATYLFKHALVQDAAYGTLLREPRRVMHARIAEALQNQFAEIAESQPELLGRHFSEAGLTQQAIRYLQMAGERAAKRSANMEAVTHFHKAKELLEALPDRTLHADQELQLLIALGPAMMATRSSTAPEIGGVYARARELARNARRTADLFPTIWGAWLIAFSGGDFATAGRLLDELFSVADASRNDALKLQAHHAAWPTLMVTGSLAEARSHIAGGLALYRREAHGDQAFQYGSHDPGVCAYVCDAMVGTVIGFPDQSVGQMRQGLVLAHELDHGPTLVQAFAFAAELHQLRREPQKVEHYVSLLFPLLEKHGSAVGLANAIMLRGWAQVMLGDSKGGIAVVREGMTAWRATGSQYHATDRLARAAEAHWTAGETEAGLQLIPATIDQSDDRWLAPELHRIKGELFRIAGRAEVAEQCLKHALESARTQKALLLELRAATSLARLWRDQGKPQQARELLAPIYDWFTEGFGTHDLNEAKVLLDELVS